MVWSVGTLLISCYHSIFDLNRIFHANCASVENFINERLRFDV